MDDERTEQVRRLYSLDPAQFTAERNGVVKELKKAKRTDDAAFIASLRKPSAIDHALNTVARETSALVTRWEQALTRATAAQSAAIGGSGGSAFREATVELRLATSALVDAALEHLGEDAATKRAAVANAVQSLGVGNGPELLARATMGSARLDVVTELFAGAPDPPPPARKPPRDKGPSPAELAKRRRLEDRRTAAVADVAHAAAALRSAKEVLAGAHARLEKVDDELRALQ